jgi:hypothetical protein
MVKKTNKHPVNKDINKEIVSIWDFEDDMYFMLNLIGRLIRTLFKKV